MNDDKYKCSKYESFFIFSNDNDFNKHLDKCEECRKTHEKYLKVSSLVKEAAPVYLEIENKKKMMASAKRLACCFVIFIGLFAFSSYKVYDNYTYNITIEQESNVSEMGLPIDKYGFLSL